MSQVFVARGDLRKFVCHAYLLPGNEDDGPGISAHWLRGHALADAFGPDGNLPGPVAVGERGRVWAVPTNVLGGAAVHLVNSGGLPDTPVEWYVDGLQEYLDVLAHNPPEAASPPRLRPLVGVPLMGTGRGGRKADRGRLMRRLLETLLDDTETRGLCDYVVVTRRGEDFAALQAERRALGRAGRNLWPDLDPRHLPHVSRLATEAKRGRLVLFLGAGVSMGAMLPSWQELLDDLARVAGFTDGERVNLKRLDNLDRARLIAAELRTRGRGTVGEQIAHRFARNRHALTHALLASLPVTEVATTNYDELFELAADGIDGRPAVLPYSPDPENDHWILKLHGTLAHPKEIVLTRDDYLAYGEERGALAGIVQGLLITKHMLFVGFSFSDDTFHRIVHDVRRAMRPREAEAESQPARPPFGTAFAFRDEPLRQRLWGDELYFSPLDGQGEAASDAAYQLELVLDRLLHEATDDARHLFDPAFTELLSEADRLLRARLLSLVNDLQPPAGRPVTAAWAELVALVERLGGRRDGLALDHADAEASGYIATVDWATDPDDPNVWRDEVTELLPAARKVSILEGGDLQVELPTRGRSVFDAARTALDRVEAATSETSFVAPELLTVSVEGDFGDADESDDEQTTGALILRSKRGVAITSLATWRAEAPPMGRTHWKEGRSAFESARAWLHGTAQADVESLLSVAPEMQGLRIVEAHPEHKTAFDDIPGGKRKHDVLLVGEAPSGRVACGVEAKADEPFDNRLGPYITYKLLATPTSRAPERVDRLTLAFFGRTPVDDPSLLELRYQLLTALAGTLADAKRLHTERAVLLIHEFVTAATRDFNHRRNAADLDAFVARLGLQRQVGGDEHGWITNAVTVPGNKHIPSDVPVHVAKLVTRLR